MKRIIFIILGCIHICLAHAQSFNGQYISEWQWDMNKNTNLTNQLRLELSVPIGKGKDSFEAATLIQRQYNVKSHATIKMIRNRA